MFTLLPPLPIPKWEPNLIWISGLRNYKLVTSLQTCLASRRASRPLADAQPLSTIHFIAYPLAIHWCREEPWAPGWSFSSTVPTGS